MLKVPIEQSKAGMVLARCVGDPQKPEHVLLKAGYTLEDEYVRRLREKRVSYIWVHYPDLDFLDKLLDPELVQQQQRLYATIKGQFKEAQECNFAKIDFHQYVNQMKNLFTRLLGLKNPTSHFVAELQSEAGDIFAHCTTIASLSLLIGMRLESYLVRCRPQIPPHLATDLTQLGVGSLLHDMGKLTLPEELRNFHITAHDRGSPQWQRHTEVGFDMIHGGLDGSAAQVVLNHHQFFDGSGFPNRKPLPGAIEPTLPLEKDDIHIFCRIACVADRFEGFRYLPDGTCAPTVVALKRMRNPGYAKWFDPVVYDAFLQSMPAFAQGEQVILNNGQTVVVTEINENHPCQPIVRPIDPDKAMNPAGSQTKQQSDINLRYRPDLYIAKVGDFDVTSYLH